MPQSLTSTDYLVLTLYSLICSIGVIGNGIVIYVIIYTSSLDAAKLYKKRHSLLNYQNNNNNNNSNNNNYENKKAIKNNYIIAHQKYQQEQQLQQQQQQQHELLEVPNNKNIGEIEEYQQQQQEQKTTYLNTRDIIVIDESNTAPLLLVLTNSQVPAQTQVQTPHSKHPSITNNKLNNNSNNNNNNSSTYMRSVYLKIKRKFSKLKLSVTNFYLINLAIVDFLFLLFIPFLIITTISRKWIFGLVLCKIYFSIVYLCQFNAAFIICILSFDRWLAVKFPLKINNYRNLFVAKLIIFFSWLLAILFTSPVITYTNQTLNNYTIETIVNFNTTILSVQTTPSCHLDWPEKWSYFLTITPLKAFQFYTLTFNYLIPVSFIIIFYIQVLRKINKKTNTQMIKSKNRLKSYRKITRMVLAVIGCYVACWTPYWSLQIVLSINEDYNNAIIFMSNLTQMVAYLNSALNPILYSYLSENFRSNFKLTFSNTLFCINSCKKSYG